MVWLRGVILVGSGKGWGIFFMLVCMHVDSVGSDASLKGIASSSIYPTLHLEVIVILSVSR